MDDKTYEYLQDELAGTELSDCCGAPIVMGDICYRCHEHCDPIIDYED